MRLSLIILFLLLFSSVSFSQDIPAYNMAKDRFGMIVGYGNQDYITVDYDYKVVFFQFQHYRRLLKKRGWGIDWHSQPQFNVTRYLQSPNAKEYKTGIEFGVNGSLFFYKNFFVDKLIAYASISSGPHFVSGVPDRQSRGFIFSDNWFVGAQIKMGERLWLDIRPLFRHISNLGITNPNGGVNNAVYSLGILWLPKEKE
ncbi:MAG: hypothetical protein HKN16_03285 [Saprospiraceae bacterium]|nr:hypothetical protein [Saprospiraceae bacterium]